MPNKIAAVLVFVVKFVRSNMLLLGTSGNIHCHEDQHDGT